jgi:hypothetical protein
MFKKSGRRPGKGVNTKCDRELNRTKASIPKFVVVRAKLEENR